MGNRQIRKTGGQRTQLPIMSLMGGEKSNFQYILRLLNTNVEGKQKVMYALTKIKGVGRRYSNLVCKKADVDLTKRAGELTSEDRAYRYHHPKPNSIQDPILVPQSSTRYRRWQGLANPRQRCRLQASCCL